MTEFALVSYSVDDSLEWSRPLPEHELETDQFMIFYTLAVKPVQLSSTAWWAGYTQEGEGKWSGWTMISHSHARFYLQDGMWRVGHYESQAGAT